MIAMDTAALTTSTPATQTVACPKCGHHGSRVVAQGQDFLYHTPGEFFASECRGCGFWFQNPRPTADQLIQLYPADYLPHTQPAPDIQHMALNPGKRRFLQRYLGYAHLRDDPDPGGDFDWRSLAVLDLWRKWSTGVELLPQYVPEGRLLEIGCGSGRRLIALRQLGWKDIHGIELVPAAAEQARKAGFSVACGPVETMLAGFPDQWFDVIVSSMVLEHLYNPFEVVREVAAKLQPGGQFLFSTISRDSLDAKLYGAYWGGFDFPRHMVYLRTDDIYAMLGEHFDQVECFHQSAPIDFIRSSTWRRGQGKLVDRIILALGDTPIGTIGGLLLAWAGLSCRVSFRGYKKGKSGS